jgi:multiple sugar transport system substrate-binding protein
MELVRTSKDITVEGLITSGDLPDILLASTTGVLPLQKLDTIEDLNPYIKKFGEDMNRFDPVLLESLKSYSDKGETVAMPYAMNFSALFYNKDIFEKFGVPYPKDGMTWDDTEALARRLTRSEGGVQYRGLNPAGVDLLGFGLSLPYVDKKTNQAVLNTDKWKMVLEKSVNLYSIPGYVVDGKWLGGQGQGYFVKDRTWAMIGAWGDLIGSFESYQKQGNPLNWDMVTLPNFKEALGYAREGDFHMLHLSKLGKHKNEAFKVLSLIASDEVQTIINKSGRLTVLKKTPEYQKTFGADYESIKGKNLNAVFGVKPNKLHPQTEFDGKGRGLMNDAATDVVLKGIDINTALRNAQDNMEQYIQEQQKK